MASSYFTRVCNKEVTSITHFLASVFTSYCSPTATAFAGFTLTPFVLTFPELQASVARLRVLKSLMAQRYLSILNFSLSAIGQIYFNFECIWLVNLITVFNWVLYIYLKKAWSIQTNLSWYLFVLF